MITSFFISIGYYIALAILAVCPSGTGFPAVFHTASQTLGGYTGIWSAILPYSVLTFCLNRIIELIALLLFVSLIRFLLRHIPFVNIG